LTTNPDPKTCKNSATFVRDLNAILRERNISKVKPGAAKVAPVWIAPKHAE